MRKHVVSMMRFGFPASVLSRPSEASSATPRPDPPARRGGKNGLRRPAGRFSEPSTTARPDASAISPAATRGSTWSSRSAGSYCRRCGGVKRETLVAGRQSVLHQAVRLLRRPAMPRDHASRRLPRNCPRLAHRQGTGEAVHAGATPAGRHARSEVIGIDEISIGKGHNYRIVVSDLIRGRPIWFGGKDRSESQHGRASSRGWDPRRCKDPPGRHGHVEAVPQLHPQGGARPAGRRSSTTSSTFCEHLGEAIDKVRKSRVRTASRGRTARSSRGRSTRCSPAGRTSRRRGAER